ncbi:MAG: DUF3990 domain-containing protein [Candidatus Symbiothrix sp.]|jgi:hypothetical protein|nr:DUF3990 domain-containing protein [Candidatus Symbiothrix sp.]
MNVYHGSDVKIKTIDLSKCRIGTDFGHGFYVTKFLKQAEDIAARVASWHDTRPVITEFIFNEYAFEDQDFSVLRFDSYTEEWLDFIVKNRASIASKPMHDYDIVEGPVANDDIAARIYDYLNGDITKEDFLDELKFKKPMHQICFCTTASLQMLSSVEKNNDSKIIQIDDLIIEQFMLDNQIDETVAADLFYNSKTFETLSDESTYLFKKSWQEIYEILKKEIRNSTGA